MVTSVPYGSCNEASACIRTFLVQLSGCRVRTSDRAHHYGVTVQNDGRKYEGWNFNSGNYLFTTDTK